MLPDDVSVVGEAVVVEGIADGGTVATFHPLIGIPAMVVEELRLRVVENQLWN